MKIGILVRSITGYYKITLENNKFIVNGKEKNNIDIEDFTRRLFVIVASWDEEMINDSILDAESYSVVIHKDDKKFSFEGRGKYPENYNKFIELVMEVTK